MTFPTHLWNIEVQVGSHDKLLSVLIYEVLFVNLTLGTNGKKRSYKMLNEIFITVRLSEIRKEVQCPICLGIIRKTRTVMECLHRFCRECIDKSMRMGQMDLLFCVSNWLFMKRLRNKQIQASIAQTLRRQSEALGRKRTARATAAAFARRSQGSYQGGEEEVFRVLNTIYLMRRKMEFLPGEKVACEVTPGMGVLVEAVARSPGTAESQNW
ncbi:hypothetical protein HAX54_030613 [Datura stramonium]|uniref:RING-type domain-containing protein n=1 Tax=Datura stramonium TaxID=4076 RepID=A0ABS8SB50_DATST|nr:hypothetical protein [Datura stramonium]